MFRNIFKKRINLVLFSIDEVKLTNIEIKIGPTQLTNTCIKTQCVYGIVVAKKYVAS